MSSPSHILMKDLREDQRPRERLVNHGPQALKDAELVAILLRTGTKGQSALTVAEQLLLRFSTLEGLACATLQELSQIKGVGHAKAIALKSAFVLAQRMAAELRRDRPLLDTPDRIADLLREDNRLHEVEVFQILMLDTRRKLMRIQEVAQGTLDTILVHPREVFRLAILSNAASIVLVHNHPSGDPSPSQADIKVTRDLIRAGELLRIEVLDHVILGRKTEERPKDYLSLRELGYFYS